MKNSTYNHVSALLLSFLICVSQLSATVKEAYLKNSIENYTLNKERPKKSKEKKASKNLSLELLNFEAIKNANKVEVFWSIKSASNNKHFTLERSKNGIDFDVVSVIDAANTATDVVQYIETDFQPLQGISYYRLRLTNITNEISYSHIVMVNNVYSKGSVNAFPNPSNGSFKLSLKGLENKEILVVLRDLGGKEYYSKVIVTLENSDIIGIDTENKLSSGTYIVTATSNNLLYSQKLIIR